MARQVELFELQTVESDLQNDRYQDIADSIDTSRYQSGFAIVRALEVTNCELVMQGSDDGQTFVDIGTLSGPGVSDPICLNRDEQPGTTRRLYRILRWKITALGTNWVCCGRISLVLK